MSPTLPTITARQLTRALKRAGFAFSRQRGSHQIYWHVKTGKRVSVPTLRQILREADISIERLLMLLEGR